MKRYWLLTSLLIAAASLGACEVGPDYRRPAPPTPGAYKEIEGWKPAQPSDAADRRDWWTVFSDPVLDQLEKEVETSNQTLAAAEAAYRQAHALVAVQRAALFPTVTGQFSPSVSGRGSGGAGGAIVTGGSSPVVVGATGGTSQSYRL